MRSKNRKRNDACCSDLSSCTVHGRWQGKLLFSATGVLSLNDLHSTKHCASVFSPQIYDTCHKCFVQTILFCRISPRHCGMMLFRETGADVNAPSWIPIPWGRSSIFSWGSRWESVSLILTRYTFRCWLQESHNDTLTELIFLHGTKMKRKNEKRERKPETLVMNWAKQEFHQLGSESSWYWVSFCDQWRQLLLQGQIDLRSEVTPSGRFCDVLKSFLSCHCDKTLEVFFLCHWTVYWPGSVKV